MIDPDDKNRPITFTDPSRDSGNTLLPMLIAGLVLIVLGGLVVVAFVF
jgi:hypothetical protein